MRPEAKLGGIRGLDADDERILRLLEANGRVSYEEIARVVHLSASAVRARVRSLTERGVIRGIHADVDWNGGGQAITALIDVRLRPAADDAAFEQTAIELPGVELVEHLAGPVHYALRVTLPNIEAIDATIRQLKENLDVETNTRIVTRTLRRTGDPARAE